MYRGLEGYSLNLKTLVISLGRSWGTRVLFMSALFQYLCDFLEEKLLLKKSFHYFIQQTCIGYSLYTGHCAKSKVRYRPYPQFIFFYYSILQTLGHSPLMGSEIKIQ